MKTIQLTPDNALWGKIYLETRSVLRRALTRDARLVPSLQLLCDVLGKQTIEPDDGPVCALETGAALYWSSSTGVATLSGYAQDGSDVDAYLTQP